MPASRRTGSASNASAPPGDSKDCDQRPAGLLAAPAGLLADFAVHHPHLRVELALGPADVAARGAGLQRRPGQLPVEFGGPGDDPTRRLADVGTVHTEVDTPAQVRNTLLGNAGIGAGRARLGAADTFVDARGKRVGIDVEAAWVGQNHLPCEGHSFLLWVWGMTPVLDSSKTSPLRTFWSKHPPNTCDESRRVHGMMARFGGTRLRV